VTFEEYDHSRRRAEQPPDQAKNGPPAGDQRGVDDAQAYCAYSRADGAPYRLPGEAEWEYRRAGTTPF
jgi:formylglycine-generating enzyme required for sulfatase activity